MAPARLSGFVPESESFGSYLVLLSACFVCLLWLLFSCVFSAIFIGDVPSGWRALSDRWGVLASLAWAVSITSLLTGDFLFTVPLSAEIRSWLPSADGGGNSIAPLGQRPGRRGGFGVYVCCLLVDGA